MTRPVGDDGMIPLKRRVQLVLRVVEGKKTLHEVVKEVKPVWTIEESRIGDDLTPLEKMTVDVEAMVRDRVAQLLADTAQKLVPQMMLEMWRWTKGNLK